MVSFRFYITTNTDGTLMQLQVTFVLTVHLEKKAVKTVCMEKKCPTKQPHFSPDSDSYRGSYFQ